MKYFNNKDLIINISSGLLQSGEETIVDNIFQTYADYLEGPFPSGEVKNSYFFETNVIYWFKENHSVSSSFNWSKNVKIFNLKLSIPIF